jgi:ribosomal protein L10
MRENGKMIRLTDLENISIQMERNMRATGKKTSSMDTVKKHGLMEHAMKGIIKKEKKTALENSFGLMDPLIKETLLTIIYMVLVSILGQTEENIMENG